MDSQKLNAFWTEHFSECPPVGFLLKHVYSGRCARLAGMNNGKERPDNESDFEEICRREGALLSHLYENEAQIVLITTSYSRTEEPVRDQPVLNRLDPDYQYIHSIGMHELALEFDTPTYWHLYMSLWPPAFEQFDALLRAAAEDSLTSGVLNMLFLGPDTKRLMYVHRQGMDVIMENDEERESLLDAFGTWKPKVSPEA